MTSRERVTAALAREPVDRLPIFMWFHPDTRIRLAGELSIDPGALDYVLGNDVRQTWVSNNYAMEGVVHRRDGESHVDQWGITWQRQYGFNQIVEYPLKAASESDVRFYRFPYEDQEQLLVPLAEVAQSADGYFLGADVSPCGFEMYWRIRGMEDALIDFATNRDLAREMVCRCIDFSITMAQAALDRFRLDWLWTGDDVAAQNGMIISPELWRDIVKPELKRLFDVGKSRGIPVAYHCCGALRPIIPDLIEIGMDVLNPVQVGCPGMDPGELKSEYGGEISFMGGIDTENLLPMGSPEQVRAATEELIARMTEDGGGYILAASHTVPPETPLENIFALYAAAGLEEEEIRRRATESV